MTKVKWRPKALDDLVGIYEYIARDNIQAADQLIKTLRLKAENISDHPRMYRAGKVAGTQEMIAHPHYIIVFRVLADEIDIVRVLHTAQQWPKRRKKTGGEPEQT